MTPSRRKDMCGHLVAQKNHQRAGITHPPVKEELRPGKSDHKYRCLCDWVVYTTILIFGK